MSRYMDIRFHGIIKKELREMFAPIALEGKWAESSDEVLRSFGELTCAWRIPLSSEPYAISRWEKDPWVKSYNEETGEWKFQASFNMHSFDWLEWEDEIIPYICESLSHFEQWMEPIGDDSYDESTILMELQDGELELVGYYDDDGVYTPIDESYWGKRKQENNKNE